MKRLTSMHFAQRKTLPLHKSCSWQKRLKFHGCPFYAMGLCYFAENNGDGRTDEEKHLQNTRTGKSS